MMGTGGIGKVEWLALLDLRPRVAKMR